jgi:hypothetical protein
LALTSLQRPGGRRQPVREVLQRWAIGVGESLD